MSTLAPAEHGRLGIALSALVTGLTLEERVSLLTGATAWTLTALPSIGLRTVTVSDGPIGVRGVDEDSTTSAQLPSPSSTAATWDVTLLAELGSLIAGEAHRKGVDVVLAPVVNLQRTPVSGRHFEFFSEDPLLTGRLAGSFVESLQSGGVGACVKHFVGNESETDRTTYVASIDERTLRENYLAPFEYVIRFSGAWTVMAAYNAFDDGDLVAPATEHARLLQTILKDEWGFDGVVISDWLANKSTLESAVGGLDLEMPGPNGLWGAALVAAIHAGSVSEDVINDKVLRILRLAERVGALSGQSGVGAQKPRPERPQAADSAQVRALLRRAAASGTVVLRNEGILPLRASTPSIALIGANAAAPFVQGGGSAHVEPPYLSDPLAAIRETFPNAAVQFARGGVTESSAPQVRDELLTTPAGEPGVLIEFLDANDRVVGSAVARADELWVRNPPGGAVTARFSTTVTVVTPGEHELEIGAVGAHTVAVDGVERSMSPHRVGAEVILNSSYSHPETFTASIHGGSAFIRAEVQIVDAKAFGRFSRLHVRHRAPRLSNDEEIELAVALAAKSDVAVVVVGTNPETESEGWDRPTLDLAGDQNELVRRVAAANPNTVVVVNAGAPVLLPWLDSVAGVLWWWLPGQEAGRSLADVLSGRIEPAGRLPWTLPAAASDVPVPNGLPVDGVIAYSEGVDIGYRGWDRLGRTPARPFGFGLGYTTWDYRDLAIDGITNDGDLQVSLQVTNTGSRPGREVVQVYLESDGTDAGRPVRWLAGFALADVDAGASMRTRVVIPRRSFQIWDLATSGWALPPGQYTIRAGRSSRNLLTDVVVGVGSHADFEASRL